MSRLDRMAQSKAIAALRAEVADLNAYCDTLKGALAAQGCETFERVGEWAKGLTGQERAFVGALFHAYPRTMAAADLLECLPGHDHVVERSVGLVSVKVCHIRRKLGADAIVNERGVGFALGSRLHAIIAGDAS